MKILYIHGFGSSGDSEKGMFLKEKFPDVEVLTPTHSSTLGSLVLVENLLKDHLLEDSDIILVGSSLGGFWADRFAKHYNLKCVLINPATTPATTLKSLGCSFWEEYVGLDDIPETENQRVVLLESGDEVIDYRLAEEKFKNIGKVVVYEGGHHKFSRMGVIEHHIRELSNQYVI